MVEIEAVDHAHGSPKPKGGARPGAGRIRKSRLLSTAKFRERCIKHWPRTLEIIAEIAEHGEPDLARFAAAKFIIERGYGLPEPADGENSGAGMTVRVISGVRDRGPNEALPPARLIAPDGRDIFATHTPGPPPSGSRPSGRAPVADPPQHRLFEDDPEIPSATVQRAK